MSKNIKKSKKIVILFIIIALLGILTTRFGMFESVQAQTGCDPATDPACPTATSGSTCGLPGLPDCIVDTPTDAPTAVIIPPTRTATKKATATHTSIPTSTLSPTSTFTPTSTLTPFPTRPPAPTAIPTTISASTVTPTGVPTPKPGNIPPQVLKLPTPPPFLVALAPRPNFEAITVEITQAIQCLGNPNCPDNSVALYVGKPTMVRLYVRLAPGSPWITVSGIGGELCPGVHGVNGCANPVHSINYITVTKLKSTTDLSLFRGNINSTLNFILPSSWTYGNFTVYVNMNGENYYLETTLKDNFISQSFQEIPSQRLDVMFVPVKSRGHLAELSERWAIRDWLTLVYPTSNIQVWEMSGYMNNTPDTYDWNDTSGGCGDGWGAVLDDLSWYKGNNPQVFYAMVHLLSLAKTPYAGCGRFTGKVAGGEVNTGDRFGPAVAAQEIGHTMQRNHAPGCDAGNPDSNYPNSGATLDEYGVDVVRNQVYVPSQSFDYMGYCGDGNTKWTSMYTYNNIASLLPDGVYVPDNQKTVMYQQPAQPGSGQIVPISFPFNGTGFPIVNPLGSSLKGASETASSASQYLVGSGFINPQNVKVNRGFFLLGLDSTSLITPDAGPYTVELLDAQGKVLSSLQFKPQEESNDTPGDTGTFHLTLPWIEGAKGYQFKYNGAVIASQTADNNLPSVENISSTGGSHWPNTGTVTISWNPVYAGGNPLQYLVQLSRDGGASWSMLSVGLAQPSLDVDASIIAGSSDSQIRVYVSDGFNTGEAVSSPFTVDNKAPDVHIGWTADGAQVKASQPVFLEGAATDIQDGPISGSALHWSLDNNPLGDGDTIVTSTIAEGNHVITLAATNGEGVTGTTSIHLTVLPPDPKPQTTAELPFIWNLLLWMIIPVGILIVVLGGILLFRRSHRPGK